MTNGISPKAILAFAFPFLATVATVAATWIAGGEFDVEQIRIAAGGLILSAIALLGAYVGKPGDVVATVGQGSDDALSDESRSRLGL